MKKIFMILGTMAILASCGARTSKTVEAEDTACTDTVEVAAADTAAAVADTVVAE